MPHAGGADLDLCMGTLVQHDQGAHYIGAKPESVSPDGQHCLICHSLRSLGSVLDIFQQRETIVAAEPLHALALIARDRLEWALVLGRAPPSTSFRRA